MPDDGDIVFKIVNQPQTLIDCLEPSKKVYIENGTKSLKIITSNLETIVGLAENFNLTVKLSDWIAEHQRLINRLAQF